MTRNKIGAVALVAVLPLAAVAAVAVGGAEAAAPHASITAKVSDPTPASGKAFTVSGTFTENKKAAGGQVVKVQTQSNGVWQALTGARERTTGAGGYQLEVILNAKGVRQLRVVGVGTGSEPNARQPFTVTVH
jgi:hypothetical protein